MSDEDRGSNPFFRRAAAPAGGSFSDVLAQAHNLCIAAEVAEYRREPVETLRPDIEDLADACDRYLGRKPRA
jgi:hypothetical protein